MEMERVLTVNVILTKQQQQQTHRTYYVPGTGLSILHVVISSSKKLNKVGTIIVVILQKTETQSVIPECPHCLLPCLSYTCNILESNQGFVALKKHLSSSMLLYLRACCWQILVIHLSVTIPLLRTESHLCPQLSFLKAQYIVRALLYWVLFSKHLIILVVLSKCCRICFTWYLWPHPTSASRAEWRRRGFLFSLGINRGIETDSARIPKTIAHLTKRVRQPQFLNSFLWPMEDKALSSTWREVHTNTMIVLVKKLPLVTQISMLVGKTWMHVP